MTTPRPDGPPEVRVGGYLLLARIGEGGMGVVHLALAPDGNRVALKVLRPHVVGDEEGRRRLDREVASLRRVHSRHVAEVLDAGPWGEAPYVVTRYVPGHSLQELVRQEGPLPEADLVHAARGLLQAVADVHAADVLHRDLKPTNVVMEGRSPILIDFGLARLADDPRLTTTGFLLGTPGYLAPEVLHGADATPATDVHGWAATMAYAATGRSPYGGGHTMAVLDRTRRGETDLSGVPAPLRPLLAAALAPEPRDRPTVAEAQAALGSLAASGLDTELVASAPRPAPAPTMPWQLQPSAAQATAPPAPLPHPPTRAYTVLTPAAPVQVAPVAPAQVRPVPPAAVPARPPGTPQAFGAPPPPVPWQPASWQPAPVGRPLSGAARLRRSLLLLGLLALVTVTFTYAPYLTFAALAVAALATRGLSRAQDAHLRRRWRRGRRWYDAPLGVATYPWHALRGVAGTVVLLGVTAVVTVVVAAGARVLGGTNPQALVVGGFVAALCVWCGPGAQRVRRPTTQLLTRVARTDLTGWLGVAAVLLATGALCLVSRGQVVWSPAHASPWHTARDLVDSAFRGF